MPRIWGLSAVEDQNVAGVIMMVEQSLTFVIALVALFVRMLTRSEEDELRRERLEEAQVPASNVDDQHRALTRQGSLPPSACAHKTPQRRSPHRPSTTPAGSWSVQQLTGFLAMVSSAGNERTASRVAVERAADALDADVAALLSGRGGRRFGRAARPTRLLDGGARGGRRRPDKPADRCPA